MARPSQDAVAEDFRAVDEGRTIRLGCVFRATYGDYPKRFRQQSLRLTPSGLLLRPAPLSPLRRTFRIREEVLEARVRPYNFKTDWNVRVYAEGHPLEHLGFEIISCRTGPGVIELAVRQPDVPLVLYYLDRMKSGSSSTPADHVVDTGGLAPAEIARRIAGVIALGGHEKESAAAS